MQAPASNGTNGSNGSNVATPLASPSVRFAPYTPNGKSVDIETLDTGDYLYEKNYHRIDSLTVGSDGKVESALVTNQRGIQSIIPAELLEELTSTSQFNREYLVVPTTLSKMPEEFVGGQPFRVTFIKDVKPNDVADALADRLAEAGESQAKRRKVMRDLMQGERRVMHAKLNLSAHGDVIMERGRYQVIDLDVERDQSKPGDKGLRWMDSRTITEIVVNGKRFYSKEHKDPA